jgi:Carboxypeptidase regulatory-like domain
MKKTTTPAAPSEFGSTGPVLGQAGASDNSAASTSSEILYLGKQQDLYLYSRLAWRNYMAHQAVFGKFSQYYTVDLATGQLKFIADTAALPDQAARVVEPLDAKDDLVGLNSAVLDMFMDGELYILRTWADPTKQTTMLNAAGKNYYEKAANFNWSSSESLISAFKLFLTLNGPAMQASGWMPEGFPKEFDMVSEPFLTLWDKYKASWDSARQERSVKFYNNNLIYKVMSEMCEVGKRKFANQPEIKKKFTITALLDEVAGNSPSGLQGLCAINGQKRYPVAGVRISAMVGTEERFALTDDKGRYLLLLPSGNYAVKVEAEGFVPQTLQKSVKIGVKSYLNITMERVAAPVVPAPVGPAPVVPAPVVPAPVVPAPVVPAPVVPAIESTQPVDLSNMVEGMMEQQVGNGVV